MIPPGQSWKPEWHADGETFVIRWRRGQDDRYWCPRCCLPMSRSSTSEVCDQCASKRLEPNPHPSSPPSQRAYDGRDLSADLLDILENIREESGEATP